MFNFEKLEVWQKTRKFVKMVYDVNASYTFDKLYIEAENIAKMISKFSKFLTC